MMRSRLDVLIILYNEVSARAAGEGPSVSGSTYGPATSVSLLVVFGWATNACCCRKVGGERKPGWTRARTPDRCRREGKVPEASDRGATPSDCCGFSIARSGMSVRMDKRDKGVYRILFAMIVRARTVAF